RLVHTREQHAAESQAAEQGMPSEMARPSFEERSIESTHARAEGVMHDGAGFLFLLIGESVAGDFRHFGCGFHGGVFTHALVVWAFFLSVRLLGNLGPRILNLVHCQPPRSTGCTAGQQALPNPALGHRPLSHLDGFEMPRGRSAKRLAASDWRIARPHPSSV